MLSDFHGWERDGSAQVSLNAPSGAGCFLTDGDDEVAVVIDYVLMHLLVLGAF